jgi:two-component system cell cycle response regulator
MFSRVIAGTDVIHRPRPSRVCVVRPNVLSVHPAASTQAPPETGLAARVLVCDDSAVIRRMLRLTLEAEGYTVETAESGEEAFTRCLRTSFDLVVSDIRMGALSGVQLCRLLRSDPAYRATPIILLTAADDPRSRFWGRHAGADAYLVKDSMMGSLVGEASRLLHTKTHEPVPVRQSPSRAEPLVRLSEVLDDLLFEAVVARDVRNLDTAHTRQELSTALFGLCAEIASYRYLVLNLDGSDGPSHHLHARGPFPEKPSGLALSALALGEVAPERIEVIHAGPIAAPSDRIASGELVAFPIRSRGTRAGELLVFGGDKFIGARDRMTLSLVANELGIVVNNLFLLEETGRLARTDALTGLANRRHTDDRLAYEIARARRNKQSLSIALCDIDHFKHINDSCGHLMGDEVLVRIGKTIAGSLRNVDIAGRWGGEEFMLVLPDTPIDGARVAAERIRTAIESHGAIPNGPTTVTLSAGVTSYVEGDAPEGMVRRADAALYRAKELGRNRVELGLPEGQPVR